MPALCGCQWRLRCRPRGAAALIRLQHPEAGNVPAVDNRLEQATAVLINSYNSARNIIGTSIISCFAGATVPIFVDTQVFLSLVYISEYKHPAYVVFTQHS